MEKTQLHDPASGATIDAYLTNQTEPAGIGFVQVDGSDGYSLGFNVVYCDKDKKPLQCDPIVEYCNQRHIARREAREAARYEKLPYRGQLSKPAHL